ncbi:hypothetical protein PMIN03_001653 [Paraphaeosphaeria minitans]
MMSSNMDSKPGSSNMLTPRNHMNAMHAATESHMHESATNMHSKRMIESPGSMGTMQTMNCRMENDAIAECERLAASPEASSNTHGKRMMAEKMMASNVMESNAMAGVGHSNVLDGDSTHMNDKAVSKAH